MQNVMRQRNLPELPLETVQFYFAEPRPGRAGTPPIPVMAPAALARSAAVCGGDEVGVLRTRGTDKACDMPA
eukprot:CAMPEP_0198578746 /NCGR_PEP_ID=MMETSP1462-20131121/120612_1 /TAXON_ID=1333877 /ORGANISM="Brandtodinium nutriculum, Strain RCC3387" /LENGTH=71 /DNA_ID=CAMNT_0044310053 /DNA_START=118 /DNA_END=330 /DNA_ORIENTATION=-